MPSNSGVSSIFSAACVLVRVIVFGQCSHALTCEFLPKFIPTPLPVHVGVFNANPEAETFLTGREILKFCESQGVLESDVHNERHRAIGVDAYQEGRFVVIRGRSEILERDAEHFYPRLIRAVISGSAASIFHLDRDDGLESETKILYRGLSQSNYLRTISSNHREGLILYLSQSSDSDNCSRNSSQEQRPIRPRIWRESLFEKAVRFLIGATCFFSGLRLMLRRDSGSFGGVLGMLGFLFGALLLFSPTLW